MNDALGPNSDEIREAAARAVAPDNPDVAELLKRKAAGETLSPAENGKIGWWRSTQNRLAKAAGFVSGRVNSTGRPVDTAPPPGNAAALGAVPSVAASGDSMVPVQPNADVVKRTTAAVLTQSDRIARRIVAREARKASASEKQIDRLDRACALPGDVKDLMVEVSPDALASVGIDPKHYPLTVFFGAFGLWTTNVWLALDEIKTEIANERADRLQQQDKRPPSTETAATADKMLGAK